MNTQESLLAGLFLAVALGVAVTLLQPAHASSSPLPSKLEDNFNHTYLQPDVRAKWWIINWGEQNGQQAHVEDFCGPSSCYQLASEQRDSYANLVLYPGNTPGYFVKVDVAEEHTGYPAEIVNAWQPVPGKPVVLETTVRWSANYKVNATGGALGSNGVWLWNSPYDNANYDPLPPMNAFGFNYCQANTFGGFLDGLKFNVVHNTTPITVLSAPAWLDMQQWNTFKFVWSVNPDGATESIDIYINGGYFASMVVPFRLGKLSTEIWQDNEHAVLEADGSVHIDYRALTEQQSFMMSSFSLRHLDSIAP